MKTRLQVIKRTIASIGYTSKASAVCDLYFRGLPIDRVIDFLNEYGSIETFEDFNRKFSETYNKDKISFNDLQALIIKYPKHQDASKAINMIPKEFYEQLKSYGYKGYQEARKKLCVPILINLLRSSQSNNFEKIYMRIGYKKENAIKEHNLLTRRYFDGIFDSTHNAITFLKEHHEITSLEQLKVLNQKGNIEFNKIKFYRIKISQTNLKKICASIIEREPNVNSITDIGKKIGNPNLTKVLKGVLTLSEKSFENLQKLYGVEIPHKKVKGRQRVY